MVVGKKGVGLNEDEIEWIGKLEWISEKRKKEKVVLCSLEPQLSLILIFTKLHKK